MTRRELTWELARECFRYDRDTGVLTWRRRPRDHFNSDRDWRAFNTRFTGRPFGCIYKNGYRYGNVFSTPYKASRLIWFWMTGRWPIEVDHENRNRSDDRWNNLREVSRKQNNRNLSRRSDNTSGVTGVSWHKTNRKWRVSISVNGRTIHLAYCESVDEAIAVRRAAERKHGFSERHGRPLRIYLRRKRV